MNNYPAENANLVINEPTNKKKNILFLSLGLIFVFLLGATFSIIMVNLNLLDLQQKNCQNLSQNSLTKNQINNCPNNYPIDNGLLTNPVVYEWRGSVEGKLIRKDEHNFTLENDKGTIEITDVMATGEIFKTIFNDITDDGKVNKVTLKDLSLGTVLRGDFWVFQNGKNTPVGGSFNIVKNK